MRKAWARVKANKGAAGVDGMSISEAFGFIRQNWEAICSTLENGRYKPMPVRRVLIPKPGGGSRPLGIPTVLDRVIQQAIAQVLTPLFDPHFSESSHGFRPGRSAHDAVRQVKKLFRSYYPISASLSRSLNSGRCCLINSRRCLFSCVSVSMPRYCNARKSLNNKFDSYI